MKTSNFFKQTSWMLSECQSEDSKKTTIVTGIKYLIKYFICAVILATLVTLLCNTCNIPFDNIFRSDEFKESMKNETFSQLALIIAILPFIEECMFRLWQSYKRWQIAIALFVIAFDVLRLVLPIPNGEGAASMFTAENIHLVLIMVAVPLLVASPIFLVSQEKVTNFGKRYGTTCAWVAVVVFALLHVLNFQCPWYAYPFAILCCGPQFVLGTTATYFRRNLGFFYAVGLHMLFNALIFIPPYMNEIIQKLS